MTQRFDNVPSATRSILAEFEDVRSLTRTLSGERIPADTFSQIVDLAQLVPMIPQVCRVSWSPRPGSSSQSRRCRWIRQPRLVMTPGDTRAPVSPRDSRRRPSEAVQLCDK